MSNVSPSGSCSCSRRGRGKMLGLSTRLGQRLSLASSWNLSRRRDSRDARVYLWRIFDFRISYLVLPSSVPLSLSLLFCTQSSPCGIDILTAVLGELQQQKSLHKYLFIYATKSTLATRSAHKPLPPPWCRSAGGRTVGCSVPATGCA